MPRTCKVCGNAFEPSFTTMQRVCTPACALAHVHGERKRQWRAEARKVRGKSPLVRAQDAFNAFIRERDHAKPCIVHGPECVEIFRFHAGHFQSVGSKPELRFNTWNCHRQCGTSNSGAHKYRRYNASVDDLYEANLRQRIGDARVDWLKGPHPPKRYRDADLERIRKIFSERARLYRRLREARSG